MVLALTRPPVLVALYIGFVILLRLTVGVTPENIGLFMIAIFLGVMAAVRYLGAGWPSSVFSAYVSTGQFYAIPVLLSIPATNWIAWVYATLTWPLVGVAWLGVPIMPPEWLAAYMFDFG